MNIIHDELSEYIFKLLEIKIRLEKWQGMGGLPRFLVDIYDAYQANFLERNHLFLICKKENDEEITPASIQKHIKLARDKWEGVVVFVCARISQHNRKRLIEYKIPFIIPGNQLYLPDSGMALREHFRQIRQERQYLSPSGQAVLLNAIIRNEYGPVTPVRLMNALNYSPMTLTRALDEIEASGLGEVESKGRERILSFRLRKKELWEKALPFLRSPVKKAVFAHIKQPLTGFFKSGYSALAEKTMLSDPSNPVYAVDSGQWKNYKSEMEIEEIPDREPGAVEVEIWKYHPGLFGNREIVDPLSLFLSLKDAPEVRVSAVLDSMLEEFFGKGN